MARENAGDRISGTWFNQLGSRLEMHDDANGGLTGWFDVMSGTEAGKNPLTGYVEPNPGGAVALGFAVSWQRTRSVTVWSGHLAEGGDVIDTTWLLSGGSIGHGSWGSTLVGHDVFRRESDTEGVVDPHRNERTSGIEN